MRDQELIAALRGACARRPPAPWGATTPARLSPVRRMLENGPAESSGPTHPLDPPAAPAWAEHLRRRFERTE